MKITNRVSTGVLAGLAGGVVFGMLMAMMGMLTTIAGMVGSTSWVVGLLVHLMMSIVIGLGFVLELGRFALKSTGSAVLWGTFYATAWWVVGVLIAMPIMQGKAPFSFDSSTLMSLMGHWIYGVILALVAKRIVKTTK